MRVRAFAFIQVVGRRSGWREHRPAFGVSPSHTRARECALIPVRVAGVFGEISGVPVRTAFSLRRDASRAGVHTPLRAGISGTPTVGAESIVVSGGYEDYGHTIIYTGHGGNDPETRSQVAAQTLTRQNLALG
jgi:SAD/SRA domain